MISDTQKLLDFPASQAHEKVPDFSAKSLENGSFSNNDRVPDFSNKQSDVSLTNRESQAFSANLQESTPVESVTQNTDSTEIPRHISCRNESLAGDVHPITGVPYELKTVEVNGETIEGVFPQFDSALDVTLPTDLHQASNKEQFKYANQCLKDAINDNEKLKGLFNDEQLEQIMNGDRPDGFVWHHSESPGVLQLVDKDTHDKTGHTGGQVIWGGGQENR